MHKIGTIAGGLVGITILEGGRDQWCLSFNELSRLVDETIDMLDMHTVDTDFFPVK